MESQLIVKELSPEAKHELTMARMSIRVHPKLAIYFIPSLQLKVMACDQIDTLCVDRNAHMLINEKFWLGLDEKTRVSAILHEVFHCAHEHPRRMDWMPPEYSFWANIAMDVVVNDTLAFYNMPIGEDWITVKYLKEKEKITLSKPGHEMSVEQVLKEMAPLRNKIQPPPEKGGGGTGGPSNVGEMTSDDLSGYFKSQNPSNKQNDQNKAGDGSQGQSQKKDIDWDMVWQQARQFAQSIGTSDQSVLRENNIPTPKADYVSFVAHRVGSLPGGDLSFQKPHRKKMYMFQHGIYPPGPGPNRPKVEFFLDVSGSMYDFWINEAQAQMQGIMNSLQQPVKLHCVNTNLVDTFNIEPNTVWPQNIPWGGGTDFESAFAEIAKDPPELLFVFTDGYTNSWATQEPEYDVVTITTGSKCPFGENVETEYS